MGAKYRRDLWSSCLDESLETSIILLFSGVGVEDKLEKFQLRPFQDPPRAHETSALCVYYDWNASSETSISMDHQ